jgi:hypothetical protein
VSTGPEVKAFRRPHTPFSCPRWNAPIIKYDNLRFGRRLLLVTDALASRKGLNRSKLVALAIRQMLEREAESEATPVKGGAGVAAAIGADPQPPTPNSPPPTPHLPRLAVV